MGLFPGQNGDMAQESVKPHLGEFDQKFPSVTGGTGTETWIITGAFEPGATTGSTNAADDVTLSAAGAAATLTRGGSGTGGSKSPDQVLARAGDGEGPQ